MEAARAPALPPTGEAIPGVRRIAVLRANALGDFLLAEPALAALRAAYPDAEISYLGAGWHPGWLAGRPGPWDRVEAVPVRADATFEEAPALRRFLAEQQARHYDLAVQLHGGGTNSNPVVGRLGARHTIGSRSPQAPPLDRWVAYTEHQHEVLRWLEVVGLAGATPVALEPRITVTAADRAEAARVLGPDDRPLVAIHAGATDPRRRWPPDRFAAVADDLAARGCQVALVGTPADAAANQAVRQAARRRLADLTGRLTLSGLTGLLERCAAVVGNDSGPRHLAAAVGTATVGIYWWGNLLTAGPLTRARHRVAVSSRLDCPVCGRDQTRGRCGHDPSFVAAVPVDEVRGHAFDLLAP